MQLVYNSGLQISIYGGPLRNPYILNSFHLHWEGEHTLNGRRYDAELHLVHFNAKYGDFNNATSYPDGLAVLGFFLELDVDGPKKLNKFVDFLKHVQNPGTMFVNTKPKQMLSMNEMLGAEPLSVYSYPGSLTTPNCDEIVTWLVKLLKKL